MLDNYSEIFSRNIGLISSVDQKKISISTIGIAGVGADGGLPAERIARLGVKRIKIADPDVFDSSNINRQYGATSQNVHRNKAEVVGEELTKIRPGLEIEIFSEGITLSNVSSFVNGCDVIIDEIEYTKPSISVQLHREARKSGLNVYVGLTLGFGVLIYRFSPNGITFEEVIGYHEGQNDEDFDMLKMIPSIPSYVDKKIVEKVIAKEMYIPAVSPAVGLLSGMMSFAVLGELIKKWEIKPVPEFVFLDLLEGRFVS